MANLRSILNDPQFPAQVERLEAAVWLDLARSTPPSRALELRTIDGAHLVLDRSSDQPINLLLHLGIDRPVSRPLLARIIAAYETAGIDSFTAYVLPIARPSQAPRILEQAGFVRGPQQAVIVWPAGSLDAPDSYFRIRTATGDDASAAYRLLMASSARFPADWAQLLTSRIGLQHWRFHAAYEGDLPYAMIALFLDGDSGYLFNRTWVLPGYDNRGAQTALVAFALRDALAHGCQWVTSFYPVTAETRTRRFQRIGFEVIYQRSAYFYGEQPSPEDLADPLSRSAST